MEPGRHGYPVPGRRNMNGGIEHGNALEADTPEPGYGHGAGQDTPGQWVQR